MDIVHEVLLRTPVILRRPAGTPEHGDRYIPSRRRLNWSATVSRRHTPSCRRTVEVFSPSSALDSALTADYRRRLASLYDDDDDDDDQPTSSRLFSFSTTPLSHSRRLSTTCTFYSLSSSALLRSIVLSSMLSASSNISLRIAQCRPECPSGLVKSDLKVVL